MKTRLTAAIAAATLALAACDNVDPRTIDTAGSAVAGGALAAVSASLLGASSGWTAVAGVAGATAGALHAQNRQTNQCAYYTGNGDEVVVRSCP
ncbi:MAG: glucose-6-phosphate isomerase [Mangrovicoccus sp.]|nr:glucose-6-phosphate isomerase [Mangrovicoccus sp.]